MAIFFELIRLRLSATIATSAMAGYLLHSGAVRGSFFFASLGILLLASGCSVFNQIQERRTDSLMERTCRRPIPAGRISVPASAGIAVVLAAAGMGALLGTGNLIAVLLGMFGAICYNGIYTPLKRRSIFALLPGALCGSVPPVVGWVAAGGLPGDYRIILLAGLFFLWQIPHFWFLANRRREDYQKAGLPTVFSDFSPDQVARILSIWTVSLIAVLLAVPAFGMIRHPLVLWPWIPLIAWFLYRCRWRRTGCENDLRDQKLFHRWNLLLGFFTITLVVDRLIVYY